MKKLFVFLFVLLAFSLFSNRVFASGPPDLNHSSHSGPSNSIQADGSTTGTITIHLEDSSGNNVTSDVISLSSSNDGAAIFNNNQTTDGSGNATFTITSKNAGTTNVTLTDNTNAATFTDWFTVTFYSATLGCSNVPATPTLSSVVSNSNHQASLTWTDSADPVSNYLISYGNVSGNYIYGDPNVGSQGTTSFTVGSLTGDKKYYFVVAASNNCGASAFSNEMSVVVQPIPAPSTPVATIEPTTTPDTSATVSTPVPTDNPVESVENTDTPTPEAVAQSGGINFKNLAIIFLVSGVVIIGLVIFLQKRGKKNPPITPPGTPSGLI